MDNGSVTFFNINAFGFYRLKQKAKELDFKFGAIKETFEDLEKWLVDKSIEETIPWDVGVHPLRSRTYCRGVVIDPETNDIVIVMLRSVGDKSGNLHGVKVGSAVGATASETVKAGTDIEGEEVIWGEPCYYWIVPSHNKMASIIFPHSGADTIRLSNYITTFVNNNGTVGAERTQHTTDRVHHLDQNRNIRTVRTIFKHVDGKDKCNCMFKFDFEQTKIKTAIKNLEVIIPNITQTIIRDTTTTRLKDERGPILRLASEYLPSLFGEHPELQAPKRIEVRIDGAPSVEEIAKLFSERMDDTDWADVGFKVKDSDIPVWLTKYIVKATLAIDSDGLSHYSPERLMNEIKLVREDLLKSVMEQEQEQEQMDETKNEISQIDTGNVAGGI
ncbi:hypothetical protein [Pectobacterium sp. HCp5_1]|uniref:hypothetical protein n=1 Tax=Pectobacterium sp. HCp5_1 TaxID=3062446 RepID=UPI00293BE3BD|nr:hypothetical protein [Pectobacterium sp. HCp5_1]